MNIPGNYYAGPALSKDGIMVVCGAGNTINAYQNTDPNSPVADFTASAHKISRGESIDFSDQSSFFEEVASIEPFEVVTIFPNPASEYFSINTDTEVEISIYNTLGVLVYTDITRARSRRINVSGWPKGIYVVRLEESGVMMQAKVIVKG